MRYYAKYNADGSVALIGTGNGGTEISVQEYNAILSEIKIKGELDYKLYTGVITIADVPAEWREEIQRRVDERIAADNEAALQDISAEEALEIILGGADA